MGGRGSAAGNPTKGLAATAAWVWQSVVDFKEVRKGLGWATDGESITRHIEYTGGSTSYPSDDLIFIALPDGHAIWYSPYHTSWGYSG